MSEITNDNGVYVCHGKPMKADTEGGTYDLKCEECGNEVRMEPQGTRQSFSFTPVT